MNSEEVPETPESPQELKELLEQTLEKLMAPTEEEMVGIVIAHALVMLVEQSAEMLRLLAQERGAD